MAYVVHFGDLQSGAIAGTLPVSAATCSDVLRDAGSFQATVAPGKARQVWQRLSHGPADMWAVEWAGNFGRAVVAAGPLLPMTFDPDGTVRLAGAGLWWVFGRRVCVHRNWVATQPPGPVWTMTGYDLGSIMMFICRETTELAGADATLPIVFEAARTGIHTRTYQPYDLPTVAQRVEELGDVQVGGWGSTQTGPDWAFAPQLIPAENRVQWRMITGTDGWPDINTTMTPLTLDASAPGQKRVRGLRGTRNGAGRVSRVFASGGGTEETKVIEKAERTGVMRLDAVTTNNSLDPALVQAYADNELARKRATPSSLELEVDAEWWWANTPGLGARIWLSWRAHPVLGDITNLLTRVIAWSADVSSPWVKLTLADTQVEI